MAFWRMSALSSRVGVDVDGGVGDQQGARIGRHVHHENVADPPGGPQAFVARRHLVHHLVGVQGALHQGFGLARPAHGHRLLGRFMAVGGIDDAQAGEVEAEFLGDRADLGFRPDQDRIDQPQTGRLHRALQRDLIAGMADRHRDRRQIGTAGDDVLEDVMAAAQRHLLKLHAGLDDLFQRRLHSGTTGEQGFALLVLRPTIQHHVCGGRLFADRDGHRDGVAHLDRSLELDILAAIDGARPRQLIAQQSRQQRPAPHAVRHHLAVIGEPLGAFGAVMGGIEIPGRDAEQLDILHAASPRQCRRITDLDLGECPVMHHLDHAGLPDVEKIQHLRSPQRLDLFPLFNPLAGRFT